MAPPTDLYERVSGQQTPNPAPPTPPSSSPASPANPASPASPVNRLKAPAHLRRMSDSDEEIVPRVVETYKWRDVLKTKGLNAINALISTVTDEVKKLSRQIRVNLLYRSGKNWNTLTNSLVVNSCPMRKCANIYQTCLVDWNAQRYCHCKPAELYKRFSVLFTKTKLPHLLGFFTNLFAQETVKTTLTKKELKSVFMNQVRKVLNKAIKNMDNLRNYVHELNKRMKTLLSRFAPEIKVTGKQYLRAFRKHYYMPIDNPPDVAEPFKHIGPSNLDIACTIFKVAHHSMTYAHNFRETRSSHSVVTIPALDETMAYIADLECQLYDARIQHMSRFRKIFPERIRLKDYSSLVDPHKPSTSEASGRIDLSNPPELQWLKQSSGEDLQYEMSFAKAAGRELTLITESEYFLQHLSAPPGMLLDLYLKRYTTERKQKKHPVGAWFTARLSWVDRAIYEQQLTLCIDDRDFIRETLRTEFCVARRCNDIDKTFTPILRFLMEGEKVRPNGEPDTDAADVDAQEKASHDAEERPQEDSDEESSVGDMDTSSEGDGDSSNCEAPRLTTHFTREEQLQFRNAFRGARHSHENQLRVACCFYARETLHAWNRVSPLLAQQRFVLRETLRLLPGVEEVPGLKGEIFKIPNERGIMQDDIPPPGFEPVSDAESVASLSSSVPDSWQFDSFYLYTRAVDRSTSGAAYIFIKKDHLDELANLDRLGCFHAATTKKGTPDAPLLTEAQFVKRYLSGKRLEKPEASHPSLQSLIKNPSDEPIWKRYGLWDGFRRSRSSGTYYQVKHALMNIYVDEKVLLRCIHKALNEYPETDKRLGFNGMSEGEWSNRVAEQSTKVYDFTNSIMVKWAKYRFYSKETKLATECPICKVALTDADRQLTCPFMHSCCKSCAINKKATNDRTCPECTYSFFVDPITVRKRKRNNASSSSSTSSANGKGKKAKIYLDSPGSDSESDSDINNI